LTPPNPTTPALPADKLQALYREQKTSPSEVVEPLIARIKALDPKLKAFTWFDAEFVRQQAKALSQDGASKSSLWGIPVLIKDNLCVEGVPTTCASKILSGFKPPYNATVVERLKAQGAILLGMANMDEFAFGSSCEHSSLFPTRNPWDLDRVPGGSSGGAAAAVAGGLAPMALGSDTGGSIRQPASFCGVVGLKPTYGRVSRSGLIAFASSLDQIGPLTKTVKDNALLLQAIAGGDPKDSTCADQAVPDYAACVGKGVKGLKLGVPKEYLVKGMDSEVRQAIEEALTTFKKLGAVITEVSLPHTEYAVPAYYIVATAEASSNLARFDGVRFGYRSKGSKGKSLMELYTRSREEGFGAEVKRRIILGTFVLSSGYYEAYYGRAMKVRTLIKKDFDEALKKVDCLVTPTSPTPAFRLGEKLSDPLTMYLSDILTISVNLAGVPGLSMPCGFTRKGLPIGLQLIARSFAEETLFQVGGAFEAATDWHKKEPKL